MKIEQEKLREKLEREKMLKESNFNEIGSFEFKTEPKPVMKSSSNIMSKSKSFILDEFYFRGLKTNVIDIRKVA